MDLSEIRAKMSKSLESLKSELAKIRTGRASTALLDTIMVDYYGTRTPLKNMATISAPEPRLLTVQPWDMSQIASIEKAISTSELSLTPTNDGKIIRIQIPPLSEERRRELVKVIGKIGEEARVAIRMIRRDANEKFKKAGLPEDDIRKNQNEIQKITDDEMKKVDSLLESKQKDILNV